MKSILIVGAGEYGNLVKELAESCGYIKIDFLDDNSELAIGKVEECDKFTNHYEDCIIAIGNPKIRKELSQRLERYFTLVSLVHPMATVSQSARIGAGCVIEAQAVISTATSLGRCCFVNAGAVVNHNSVLEEYCQIDCNAVVAARARVPEGTKVRSCTVWDLN